MRVFPLYITVFFIAKAAIAHGFQDSSAKDVARQEHPRRQREDFVRSYPKRVVHMKGRGRYYNEDSRFDSANPVFYVPIAKKGRFVKTRRKMPSAVEGSVDAAPQGPQGSAKGKINWTEIVQEINTISRTTPKDQPNVGVEGSDQPPAAYVVSIANPGGGTKNTKIIKEHVFHNIKPVCDCPGPCNCPKPCGPECPTCLENVYQCPKCRTHYVVRMNFKESKCGHSRLKTEKKASKRQSAKAANGAKTNSSKTCNCAGPCSCPHVNNPAKACKGGCCSPPESPECCNNLRTMFKCPKCNTYYAVSLSMRESKCCAGCEPPPPSCSKAEEPADLG